METDLDMDVLGDLVATHGPFELTKTGVIVAGEPTFEEWEAAFTWAQQVEKASPFWVGDLIEYGEHRYGEKYAQALDLTTASYGTLANAAYVARNVQISRRRENLPFAMHQEVAPLPAAEQDVWLDKCEAEGLSQKQLRIQIRVAKAESEGHPVELWLLVKCANVDDQNMLADRLRLEGRSVKLTTKET